MFIKHLISGQVGSLLVGGRVNSGVSLPRKLKMQYFTDEKFEKDTAHKEYEEHCRSNWEKFPYAAKAIQFEQVPDDLLSGIEKVSLHDSVITSFYEAESNVKLTLETDFNGKLRVVNLTYAQVKTIKKPSKDRLGSDPENPNSDIMCHETNIKKGLIVHSLLFASGEEMEIVCESMALELPNELS